MSLIGWIFEIIIIILCGYVFFAGSKKNKEVNPKEVKKIKRNSLVALAFFTICMFVIFPSGSNDDIPASAYDTDEDAAANLANDAENDLEDDYEENVEEDTEETFPVAFSYDDKEAKADASGKYNFSIKVKKGYTASVDSNKDNNASITKGEGGTFSLQGTIKKQKKNANVTVTFTSKNDEQYKAIEVSNKAAVEKAKAEDAALWDKMARENEIELTYGKLVKTKSLYATLPYHITKGKVMQAQENDEGDTTLLVQLTVDEFGFWDDIIAIYVDGYTDAVDDDFVEVTGTLGERWDYETAIGGTNSVPSLKAEKIDVIGHDK